MTYTRVHALRVLLMHCRFALRLLQETVLEVLRSGWKDQEEADKGKPSSESAFEQKRFAADWWDGE